MFIGVDGNEANVENRVGINVYAFELLCSIYELQNRLRLGGNLPQGINPITFVIFLKNPPLKDLPNETEFWEYKVIPGRTLWVIKELMPFLFKMSRKPDVFFSPSHYLPPFAPMPRVCSIMDLGYLEFSEQFKKSDYWQLKYWTAISIYISKKIIAISNSTRQDIVRHYPFTSDKVSVVHLGYDKSRFNSNISPSEIGRVKNKYHIVNDYILFLSTLKPSKNIEGLIEAYKLVQDGGSRSPSLVIAGKKGWLYDEIFKKVERLNLGEKVIFTDFVSEEDKPGLITGSRVFVSPSFWEGFGLHVLEAMACGVPVVVSNRGSLPEIVGNAGIKINPINQQSIANGISKVLRMDENQYNGLVRKVLNQASGFSWEKTALSTLKIFEEFKNKL